VAGHPVRIALADDLRRSRLTVLFRLLLTLPHFVWLALWSVPALVAGILNSVVVLVTGRTPRPFQRFLGAYVRYSTQVAAFMHLATNPFPGFVGDEAYPLQLEIDHLAGQRRLVTLFKFVLIVPALLLATAFGGFGMATAGNAGVVLGGFVLGLGLVYVAAFLAWFACLVRGRIPDGLRDLAVYSLSYGAQLSAYALSLTDRYPTSDPNAHVPRAELPAHPIRLVLADDLRRSRLTVFFRLLLAIPHILLLYFWTYLMYLVAIVNWGAALILGRLPEPLHRITSAYVRYLGQVYAYLGLVANPFPGIGSAYPLELEVDAAARQKRLVTLFRLVLGIPALLIASMLGLLFFVAGFLGWFASLATGRMPVGLRNVGASSIRYTAQTYAYFLLLTDRYPYSSPAIPARREPEPQPEPEWGPPSPEPEAAV
jgi:Domain of unknown function (DUF4389)